ncbi:hypothetical protein QBZ16_004661 [Prototheca wickerhamii]|uniref:Pseudouridine synthase RsuA/RluA-like domain-containing protein n=1 Tax=Prototheca wickerhamii TaxID=3111 RepID=A0AAD9IGH2_PROWI|nr:hypothetical protein QBZ16_004661 [Prototheca wickerhamii]
MINGYRFVSVFLALEAVKPYHFDFACSVKERWAGQTLLEVNSPPDREPLSPDTILQPGQRMRHLIHRHEPPVRGGPVLVLGCTAEVVAVAKPAGMPVHVSGQYRKNTVLGVLQAERPDLLPLHPAHRLDKPVSGALLFARSPAAADALRRRIEAHDVEKVYVARVQGAFPATPEPLVVDVPLAWDQQRNHVLACPGALVEEEEQGSDDGGLGAEGEKMDGACTSTNASTAHAQRHAFRAERRERAQRKREAKERRRAERAARGASQLHAPKRAVTEVRRLAVAPDGQTSLVECRPRTGRTHQIRVHLQHLGHPIANDGQYGGRFAGPLASRLLAANMGVAWDQMRVSAGLPVWGAAGGAGGENGVPGALEKDTTSQCAEPKRPRTDQEASPGLGASHAPHPDAQAGADSSTIPEPFQPPPRDADTYAQNKAFRSDDVYRVPEGLVDAECPHCPFLTPVDYPLDLRPLWLHARTYACSDWRFEAPLPDWADAQYEAAMEE